MPETSTSGESSVHRSQKGSCKEQSEMSGRDLSTDEHVFVSRSVLREEPCTDPYARFCGQTEASASSDPIEFTALCVPGMGMILWGASPLYIFREGVTVTTSKSTSRRQGLRGDPMSERSRSANLRADEQKQHSRPNPWARGHNIPKPVRRTWGLVNAAVVQGKIMFLPGEICPALRPPMWERSKQ